MDFIEAVEPSFFVVVGIRGILIIDFFVIEI